MKDGKNGPVLERVTDFYTFEAVNPSFHDGKLYWGQGLHGQFANNRATLPNVRPPYDTVPLYFRTEHRYGPEEEIGVEETKQWRMSTYFRSKDSLREHWEKAERDNIVDVYTQEELEKKHGSYSQVLIREAEQYDPLHGESEPLRPDTFIEVAQSCMRDAELLQDISASKIRLTQQELNELTEELMNNPIQPGHDWEYSRLNSYDGFMNYEKDPEMDGYTPSVRRLLDHLDTVQVFTSAEVVVDDEGLPFLKQPMNASVGVELNVDRIRNGVYTLSFTATPCRTGTRMDTQKMQLVALEMQTAADLLQELNARGPITITPEEIPQLRDFYAEQQRAGLSMV